MNSLFAIVALIQAAQEQSTFSNILHSLPSDPASLFTLALVVGVTVLVVVAGRSSGKKKGDGGGGTA